MKRTLIAALLAGLAATAIITPAGAEDWRHQDRDYWRWQDRNHDGRIDRRDDYYYRSQRHDYDRGTTYRPVGQCRFATRRGAVTGYVPEGKDRCCIETRQGVSCQ
ncbi:MAG TPA: hypothetical protein VJR58_03735 [Vineibacter sp.]|nr:hypothetical protein [Vineibacter sp.]